MKRYSWQFFYFSALWRLHWAIIHSSAFYIKTDLVEAQKMSGTRGRLISRKFRYWLASANNNLLIRIVGSKWIFPELSVNNSVDSTCFHGSAIIWAANVFLMDLVVPPAVGFCCLGTWRELRFISRLVYSVVLDMSSNSRTKRRLELMREQSLNAQQQKMQDQRSSSSSSNPSSVPGASPPNVSQLSSSSNFGPKSQPIIINQPIRFAGNRLVHLPPQIIHVRQRISPISYKESRFHLLIAHLHRFRLANASHQRCWWAALCHLGSVFSQRQCLAQLIRGELDHLVTPVADSTFSTTIVKVRPWHRCVPRAKWVWVQPARLNRFLAVFWSSILWRTARLSG